jgi:hypothetical protein
VLEQKFERRSDVDVFHAYKSVCEGEQKATRQCFIDSTHLGINAAWLTRQYM